ncbi:MAG: hypothetical protein ACRDYU_19125 [Actinomycetes bacterium]
MNMFLALILLAVVAAVIGLATAAKWLFIIALVLLAVGLLTGFRGRGRTRV